MTDKLSRDDCAFCAIVDGRAHAAAVFENESSLAFLDIRPLFFGHSLLVPKRHVATLTDLPREFISPLFESAKLMATAVEAAMEAEGTFVAMNNVVSQSVPHLHVHVVPRRRKDGLRGFFWPRQRYRDDAHMEQVRQSIADAVAALRHRASGMDG